jgi:hypothetical protein
VGERAGDEEASAGGGAATAGGAAAGESASRRGTSPTTRARASAPESARERKVNQAIMTRPKPAAIQSLPVALVSEVAASRA